MKKFFLALSLLLSTLAVGQNVFPAKGTNNIFSGQDTFSLGIDLALGSSGGYTFSNLPTSWFSGGLDGLMVYCKDCQLQNPCVAGGTGAFARHEGGVWDCGGGSGGGGAGPSSITTSNGLTGGGSSGAVNIAIANPATTPGAFTVNGAFTVSGTNTVTIFNKTLTTLMGNSATFQLAGAINGTAGNPLCEDANKNTTDVGCNSGTGTVLNSTTAKALAFYATTGTTVSPALTALWDSATNTLTLPNLHLTSTLVVDGPWKLNSPCATVPPGLPGAGTTTFAIDNANCALEEAVNGGSYRLMITTTAPTTGFIPKYIGPFSVGNTAADEGITSSGTYTVSEPFQIITTSNSIANETKQTLNGSTALQAGLEYLLTCTQAGANTRVLDYPWQLLLYDNANCTTPRMLILGPGAYNNADGTVIIGDSSAISTVHPTLIVQGKQSSYVGMGLFNTDGGVNKQWDIGVAGNGSICASAARGDLLFVNNTNAFCEAWFTMGSTQATTFFNNVGRFGRFNGIVTSSANGAMSVPLQVGTPINVVSTLVAQSGTILAVTTTGFYLIQGYVNCDTAVATATVTPSITYVDPSNTSHTVSPGAATCTTLGASSFVRFSEPLRALTGTNITYSVVIANSPRYDVSISLEQLSTQ